MYRIRPGFRSAQFSRIALSKHFAETLFADQEFRVYGILKFRELNFRELLESAKTAKITRLENLTYMVSLFIIVVRFRWLVGKLVRRQARTVQASEAAVYRKFRVQTCQG